MCSIGALSLHRGVTGQNGSGQNGIGQNGRPTDKMTSTIFYFVYILIQLNSIYI